MLHKLVLKLFKSWFTERTTEQVKNRNGHGVVVITDDSYTIRILERFNVHGYESVFR
jgi:hypothetical protein